MVLAALLFASGLFFNALQPVAHAMVADLAAPAQRGAAFGTYNLIGEIGAVLSPDRLRHHARAFGGWAPAVYLEARWCWRACCWSASCASRGAWRRRSGSLEKH